MSTTMTAITNITEFFKGIQDSPNMASRRPQVDEKFESNVKGLYVIGDLSGAPVVKLAMAQGNDVAEHIASLPGARGNDPAVYDLLVVGAGASGSQIADELLRAGRRVFLSIGPHDRPPIRYRGKDFCWWLGVLGQWDAKTKAPDMDHVTIAVSGAYGGITVDFRRFAARGMTLLGRAGACADGVMQFAPDLERNIRRGDANYLAVLDAADAYASANNLDLPPEPTARQIDPMPAAVTDPVLALNLSDHGITAIIWATGYRLDFGWLQVDTFDARGTPLHDRGVARVPGLYFLGLPWLTRRASAFIWGVWQDAEYLADYIAARG